MSNEPKNQSNGHRRGTPVYWLVGSILFVVFGIVVIADGNPTAQWIALGTGISIVIVILVMAVISYRRAKRNGSIDE